MGGDEQCPVCGRDNQCQLARGHLYKGPCWCQEIVVPNQMLRTLAEGGFAQRCLCRSCLEAVARLFRDREAAENAVAQIREAAIERRSSAEFEEDFYLDENGNTVFTANYHLKRGTCCQNGCRHCPF